MGDLLVSLHAAIHMASRWFGGGVYSEVRLGEVHGSSCERPGWLDDVDFGDPLYVTSPLGLLGGAVVMAHPMLERWSWPVDATVNDP